MKSLKTLLLTAGLLLLPFSVARPGEQKQESLFPRFQTVKQNERYVLKGDVGYTLSENNPESHVSSNLLLNASPLLNIQNYTHLEFGREGGYYAESIFEMPVGELDIGNFNLRARLESDNKPLTRISPLGLSYSPINTPLVSVKLNYDPVFVNDRSEIEEDRSYIGAEFSTNAFEGLTLWGSGDINLNGDNPKLRQLELDLGLNLESMPLEIHYNPILKPLQGERFKSNVEHRARVSVPF